MHLSLDEATASAWDFDLFFDKEANSPKTEASKRRVLLERGGDACAALGADTVAPKRESMTI